MSFSDDQEEKSEQWIRKPYKLWCTKDPYITSSCLTHCLGKFITQIAAATRGHPTPSFYDLFCRGTAGGPRRPKKMLLSPLPSLLLARLCSPARPAGLESAPLPPCLELLLLKSSHLTVERNRALPLLWDLFQQPPHHRLE